MSRDKTLDYLRGFAILQVVFVHILYWLSIFNTGLLSVIKSFFLFEMPIFFFVTGAVNGLGNNTPYKAFCFKRIKSILLPYYVYSALCIVISALFYLAHNQFSIKLILKVFLTWLIPLDHQIMPLPYFTWAIWFIPVYIISIVLFPVLRSAVSKFGGGIIILFIVSFLVVESGCNILNHTIVFSGYLAYIATLLDLLQKTSFYLVFVCIGLLYPKLKTRTRQVIVILLFILFASLLGIIICKCCFGNTLNMQNNKFPPNHVFLLYSFAILIIIYLSSPIIKKGYYRIVKRVPILDKLILLFSKNSIYVFLYQSFSFWLISIFFSMIPIKNDLIFVIAVITIFPMIWLTIKTINRLQSHKKKATKL